MSLSEFRDTYSWQGAIDLGPSLAALADELPAAEQMGLAMQLRTGMVELPAAIAVDLADESNTRHMVALRLVAAVDLIDRVYPALDTARPREALEKLVERLSGPGFNERKSGPAAIGQSAGPAAANDDADDAAAPALKIAVSAEAAEGEPAEAGSGDQPESQEA